MRALPLACLALLIGVPFSFAHTNGGTYGTPKPYCEYSPGGKPDDVNVHDYAVNGATRPTYLLAFFVDGNVADCDADGVPFDSDGHSEWAIGGAWLLSSEAGAPDSGATACFGEYAHHPTHPLVWIFDHVWPARVLFLVGTDTTSLHTPAPGEPNCGDGVDDVGTGYCMDHCTVGIPPGLDGAYHVYAVNDEGILCSILPTADPPCPFQLAIHLATAGHVYT